MNHAVLRDAIRDGASGLVDREHLLELVVLAAVAREHILVIGPPGTAKSEAVRRVARAFDARTFEALLGRFTEPNELFGPVDLQRLREGVVETRTDGMLPEADFAFLDEIFLGSTAILNTLLGVLQDRVFRRGHSVVRCPLRACVGAANEVPRDGSLAAFADRFLLRVFVSPIPDPLLEDLLVAGRKPAPPITAVPLSTLDELTAAADAIDLDPVTDRVAMAIRTVRNAGIQWSDRRAVKVQRLVAAAAALAGRDHATDADLWPILYAIPTEEGQQFARTALRELLERSESPTLVAAAEDASAGPLARARRLAEAGRALLAAPGEAKWRLQLEGLAREIDSGFGKDALPAELAEVRRAIVAALR